MHISGNYDGNPWSIFAYFAPRHPNTISCCWHHAIRWALGSFCRFDMCPTCAELLGVPWALYRIWQVKEL